MVETICLSFKEICKFLQKKTENEAKRAEEPKSSLDIANHLRTGATTLANCNDTVAAVKPSAEGNLSMEKRKKRWTMTEYLENPLVSPHSSPPVIWLNDAEFLTKNNNLDYVVSEGMRVCM